MSTNDFSKCLADIERVGKEIARKHADDVDQNSRFPTEAVAALKAIGAFIWPIPIEYGGVGANILDLAKACRIIGKHCSATASVLSMHYTQILSVMYHCEGDQDLQNYLRRCASENPNRLGDI
jgi:acyl-CoA dehydrogenase